MEQVSIKVKKKTQSQYLDYVVDPSFHEANKRSVLLFKNTEYFLPDEEVRDG